MDGDQILDFFWIDPIAAAKRFVWRPRFSGKLYTKYERQSSLRRPAKRAYGRSNSGLVFQSAYFVDKYSSPLLLLFYADKSYSGKHRSHHPIYSKHFICNFENYRVMSESCNTLLCINLSVRSQPTRRRAAEAWELDPNWMDAMFWWRKGKDFEARARLWVMQCQEKSVVSWLFSPPPAKLGCRHS